MDGAHQRVCRACPRHGCPNERTQELEPLVVVYLRAPPLRKMARGGGSCCCRRPTNGTDLSSAVARAARSARRRGGVLGQMASTRRRGPLAISMAVVSRRVAMWLLPFASNASITTRRSRGVAQRTLSLGGRRQRRTPLSTKQTRPHSFPHIPANLLVHRTAMSFSTVAARTSARNMAALVSKRCVRVDEGRSACVDGGGHSPCPPGGGLRPSSKRHVPLPIFRGKDG